VTLVEAEEMVSGTPEVVAAVMSIVLTAINWFTPMMFVSRSMVVHLIAETPIMVLSTIVPLVPLKMKMVNLARPRDLLQMVTVQDLHQNSKTIFGLLHGSPLLHLMISTI